MKISAIKMLTATALLVAAAALISGCATTVPDSAATSTPSASATNPYGGGFEVSPPSATDVVLTVTGTKIVNYTMGQLKALGTQSISIVEPFVKKQQTFVGVPLKAILEASGITPTQHLQTIALNDYVFKDTAANFESNNGLMAISRDGAAIPMDEGGPIRIVFPSDSKYFTYLDAWNWSMRSIKVGN